MSYFILYYIISISIHSLNEPIPKPPTGPLRPQNSTPGPGGTLTNIFSALGALQSHPFPVAIGWGEYFLLDSNVPPSGLRFTASAVGWLIGMVI